MHPTLFTVTLTSYGAAMAAAYLCAILWLKTQMKPMGLDEAAFWRLIYCLFFGAVAGGKLLFLAVSYRELLDGRMSVLGDLRYGFVFFGGFMGAVAMGWAATVWMKLDFLSLADFCGVALPMGQAVGRLGCLAAGCCYGRPTSLPWGVRLGGPESSTPPELWGTPLHPTQVYESLADAAIALLLMTWLLPRARRRELRPGTVFFAYMILYGAARFAIEFLRFDDRGSSLPPFSISQWLALGSVAAAGALLFKRGVRMK